MILKSINSAEVVSTDFFLDTTAFHIILFSLDLNCWAECLGGRYVCWLQNTRRHCYITKKPFETPTKIIYLNILYKMFIQN